MRFPNKFKNRKSLYATRCTTHMNVSVWNKGRNQKSQTKKKNKERRLYQTLPRQNDMCEHNFAPKLESRVWRRKLKFIGWEKVVVNAVWWVVGSWWLPWKKQRGHLLVYKFSQPRDQFSTKTSRKVVIEGGLSWFKSGPQWSNIKILFQNR